MKRPARTVLTGPRAIPLLTRCDKGRLKHRLFYINKKPQLALGHYSFKELNEITNRDFININNTEASYKRPGSS